MGGNDINNEFINKVVIDTGNPLLTHAFFQKVLITPLDFNLKKKIIEQLIVIGKETNFLTQWENEKNSDFKASKNDRLREFALNSTLTPSFLINNVKPNHKRVFEKDCLESFLFSHFH